MWGYRFAPGALLIAIESEQGGDALVAVIHDALFHFTLDPESRPNPRW